MEYFDVEKSRIKTKVNGKVYSHDSIGTMFIYNIYRKDDESKTIYTSNDLTTNTMMYYTSYNNDQIKMDTKYKLIASKIEYITNGDEQSFVDENVAVQAQGDATLTYPKKSLKLKFNKSRKFKGFDDSKTFSLKNDGNQCAHTAINGCGNIWRQMVENRDDFDELPDWFKSSKAKGSLNGRPIKVYYVFTDENGEDICDYMGIYTMSTKKGDRLAGFSSSKQPNAFIISMSCINNAGRSDLGAEVSNFTKTYPRKFNKIWNGLEDSSYGGYEFEDGDEQFRDKKVQFINKVIDIFMNEPEETFKAKIQQCLDVTSFLDLIIFTTFAANPDLNKNMLMFADDFNDGGKLYAVLYDYDASAFTGWDYFAADGTLLPTAVPQLQACCWAPDYDWITRMHNAFLPEIKARYFQLRERNVLNESNITQLFASEYLVVSHILHLDRSYIDANGNYVAIPEHSTRKFISETVLGTDKICGNSINVIQSLYDKIAKRIVQTDQLYGQIENFYPYAVITGITKKQDEILVDANTTSLNIFDYFDYKPLGDYIHNENVYKNVTIHNLTDTNGIISSISPDGTIVFSNNEGETKISLTTNQLVNTIMESKRGPQITGKVVSDTITIKRYTANATAAQISIVNGEPYQYGKEVIIESVPNGKTVDSTWSVTPSDTRYSINGNKLRITTKPMDEHIVIEYKGITDDGEFTETLEFDTIVPSLVFDKGSSTYGIKSVQNIPYNGLIIEGEFSIDFNTCIDGAVIGAYIFGNKNGKATYPSYMTTDTHDEVGIFCLLRRFNGKTLVNPQFFFNKNFSQATNTNTSDAGAISGTAFTLNHPLMFEAGERIYFKMCEDYFQINDRIYPWVYKGVKSSNTKITQPLRIFGNLDGTAIKTSGFKNSLYWLKVHSNGNLISHIVPNDIEQFESDKTYAIKDLVKPSNNIVANLSPTAIQYTQFYPCPSVGGLGINTNLPNNDTGVPFNNTDTIDTGIVCNNDLTYEIKFKPMFSQTKNIEDHRGRLFGAMQLLNKKFSASTVQGIRNYDLHSLMCMHQTGGGIVARTTDLTSTPTAVRSNIVTEKGVIYKAIYSPTKLQVFDENDTLLKETNLTRKPVETDSTIYLGCLNCSYNDAEPFYQGFYGYIYSFKISDSNGTLLDLTPNAKRTGFIDAVSEKEFLIHSIPYAATKSAEVSIDIADGTEISGKQYQFALTDNSYNDVISTSKFVAPSPNFDVLTYIDMGVNNHNIKSEFIWEVDGNADEYARIDNNGLLTIYESANQTEVVVKCYWSLDKAICDTKTVKLSYE